jgi:CheY-like chemotaxis protein
MLVEDSEADVALAKEIFKEGGLSFDLHVAYDGVEALAMLRREGEHAGLPHPDFILLDLNMPRMDGREFLSIIKADATLKRIPVLVMSTSDSPRDVLTCYELQANAYIAKPLDIDDFITLVESIRDFWCRFALVPPKA